MNKKKQINLIALAAVIVLLEPAFVWAAYPAEVPRTGQTTCYNSAGTVIGCVGTGQDGDIQAGVAWPSPRFVDNGNGTVTDKLTGLMWIKDDTAQMNWQEAFDYVVASTINSKGK